MAQRTLIRSRLLWDGTGSPPIENAEILIDGERIVAVGHLSCDGNDGKGTSPPASLESAEQTQRAAEEKQREKAGSNSVPSLRTPASLCASSEAGGESSLSADPLVIDLGDACLLPGFVDMHIHLDDDGWTPLRLLANGITTVRDTGNNAASLIALRDRQQRGDWTGPRIFTFGPLIDGDPAHWAHIALPVADPETTREHVRRLVEIGVDGLKTYVNAPPTVVGFVIDEAHRHGKKVTCHAGRTSVTEAIAMGIDCAEHVFCLDVRDPGQHWSDLDAHSPRARELMNCFIERGVWFTPTLAVMRACQHYWGRPFNTFPGFEEYPTYLRRWIKETLATRVGSDVWDEEKVAKEEVGFQAMQEVARAFHEAGIPLLAGSDSPFVPIGAGFHYELALLAEAGIPNADLLTIATRRGAEFLGQSNDFGTLEPGKLADIVAVAGDPLADIHATRRVTALWQRGRRLDPAALRAEADAIVAAAPTEFDEQRPPFGLHCSGR